MIGIYCRRSREADQGRSIENQIEDGIRFAESMSESYRVYLDKDISGGKGRDKRPDFNLLLNDIEDGFVTAIFVSDQDRTARDEITWFQLANLCIEHKVKFYERGVLVDLERDYSFRGMKAVWDADYRRTISRKFKRALLINAEKGRRFSFIQFGYKEGDDKKLIIDEDKRKWVEDIFRKSLEGEGVQRIANYLNEHNVPTTYAQMETDKETYLTRQGKVKKKSEAIWRGNTIRGIITNPIYKGHRKWGDRFFPAPAYFEEWYWEKVNENLKSNSNRKGRINTHDYLLKGFVKCGKCGNNYYGRTRKDKSDHVYMCSSRRYKDESCGNRSINIDALESLVWFYFINSGMLMDIVTRSYKEKSFISRSKDIQKKLDAIADERQKLDFNMKNILDAISDGIVTREDAKAKIDEITSKRIKVEDDATNLRRDLDHLHLIDSKVDELKQLKDEIRTADFDKKREIIGKFIDKIEILFNGQEYEVTIRYIDESIKPTTFIVSKNYKTAYTDNPAPSKIKNPKTGEMMPLKRIEVGLKLLMNMNRKNG